MTPHPSQSSITTWQLFQTTQLMLLNQLEQELATAGLPPLAWLDVMLALQQAPEHHLRMHQLAQIIVRDRSHLTRLIDRLEAQGLVCRKSCPNDRRGAFAAITDAGLAMLEKMLPIYQQAIAKYFAVHFSDTELSVLTATLERLQAGMLDATVPNQARSLSSIEP